MVTAFGQGKQNVIQTGVIDARGLAWQGPTATFASAPSPLYTGAIYTFTDASATGTCTGGGSALALCRYNGSGWDAIGGSGGGSQTSIFSGGTQVQRYVQCATGTVPYTTLNALAAGVSGEVTLQTGISGDVRWEHVQVSETTAFTGINQGSANQFTVSMGRPGTTNDEMIGALVPLQVSSGDTNYWNTRPIPPALTSTYSVVLNFATSAYYSTGTITATNGSATITGSGTTWTSSMTGMKVNISGVYYAFTYVSATSATISPVYAGSTASGIGNVYIQNFPNQATAGVLSWELCGYVAK